jgi:isoleucyl-tRNA synthetase
MAEVAITSALQVLPLEAAPANAFRLPQETAAAVEIAPAPGRKCVRSWKYAEDVGSDPDYPDVTPRDAAALREFDALRAS